MSRRRGIAACLAFSMILTGCAVKQKEAETENNVNNIAVTSVATLEILDAMGVENIVGVPQSSSAIPKAYENAKKIGTPMSPDLEQLKTLDLSLVISPVSLQGDLEAKYEGAGIPSYFINLNSVEGMYDSIKELGDRFGKQKEADKLQSQYEAWLLEQNKKQEGREEKTVLILMGLPGSYVVATEHSYIGNLVSLAGGKNVYEGYSEEDFINVNTEDMLQKAPDVIIRTSHAMPEQVMEMFQTDFAQNDIWKHFEAVKQNEVYDLTSTNFGMSATLQYAKAVEELEGYLYP